MSAVLTAAAPDRRRSVVRSVAAVAIALVVNAVVSLAIDQLFHIAEVYPPWGEPMYETGDNLLALSYRLAIGVGSGYLVAWLAPGAPIRHAVVLGIIATVLATIGAVVTITRYDLGPAWYPVSLAILAYPTIRLGAAWYERRIRRA